jgi:hypothetical protein
MPFPWIPLWTFRYQKVTNFDGTPRRPRHAREVVDNRPSVLFAQQI